MPNAANTPAVSSQQNGTLSIAAESITEQYNTELDSVLDALETGLPEAEFIRLDIFTILNDVTEAPTEFGFRNVTDSCITPGVVEDAICNRPNKYLFWDFIHPTRRTHRILSERAENALEDHFYDD
jgi:phospholipase/lecithinase/hemolysin